MNGNSLRLRQLHEIGKLPISPQQAAAAEADESRRARLRERHAARKSIRADYRFHRLVPSGLSSMTMPWEARDFLISSASCKVLLLFCIETLRNLLFDLHFREFNLG